MCENSKTIDIAFYFNVICAKDCFLKFEEKWFFVNKSGGYFWEYF